MKRTTQWSPDTCGCVFEYEWDDADNESVRQHTLKNVVKRCSEHSENGQVLYGRVLAENVMKNKCIGIILENFPDLTEQSIDPTGNTVKKFKAGQEPQWSFDKDRKLNIESKILNLAQKAQLKSLSDSAFGIGSVQVK